MNDIPWSLIVMAALGYLLYKHFSRKDARRFGVLTGGRRDGPQFEPVQAPEPQIGGSTPPTAVLGWPDGGCCKPC